MRKGTIGLGWGAPLALGAAFGLAACVQPKGAQGAQGEAYTVSGDPWAAPSAGRDAATAAPAAGDPARAGGGASDPRGATPPAAPATAPATAAGGGTVLEQLDSARARADELDQLNKKLSDQVASLTAVVEGLKRDNANLAQLVDANAKSREGVDGELAAMGARIKELELRALQLADDLLAERIKRVRVERQLILAKVAEAENAGDGN